MGSPVLPYGSLGGIQGSSTAGMRHTARRWLEPGTRQLNGEVVTIPTWGQPICCHLKLIGSQLAEIAAARGIKAQWSLKVPEETDIPGDSIWEVQTHRGTETVAVTGDLMRLGRVMRLVAAIDTRLNR